MSVAPSSTIVGVFRDRSMAEQAVNALYKAGFGHEQIQYSTPGTSDSFFEGLKSLFTGTSDNQGNLVNDLTNMGLSDAEAQYYANEYNNGNTILVVRAAGRETEAMNILHQYGAYNAETNRGSFSETGGAMQQPGDYTQQGNYATSGQYENAQEWGAQPQSQTVEQYPFAGSQPGNIPPEHTVDYQNTQPVTPVSETESQHSQADVAAPVYDTAYQTSQPDTVISEQGSEMPASQASQPGVAAPHTDEDYQAARVNEVAPEQGSGSQTVSAVTTQDDTQPLAARAVPVTPSQETEMQSSQTGVASPEQTDELQPLQAQLQTLQQQLQEAKAQLQAAKEQEDQLRTARERQQQLQSARQQIQDLQAELQATLTELRETQSRIAQYQ